MARPGRFELPTLCLEGRRSIQLSYGRTVCYSDFRTLLAPINDFLAAGQVKSNCSKYSMSPMCSMLLARYALHGIKL